MPHALGLQITVDAMMLSASERAVRGIRSFFASHTGAAGEAAEAAPFVAGDAGARARLEARRRQYEEASSWPRAVGAGHRRAPRHLAGVTHTTHPGRLLDGAHACCKPRSVFVLLAAAALCLLPSLVLMSMRGLTTIKRPTEDWAFFHPSTAFGDLCDNSSRMESGFIDVGVGSGDDVESGRRSVPNGIGAGSGSPSPAA